MVSAFAQTTDADRIADGIVFEPVTSTMSVSAVKTAVAESQQSTLATLTAQGDVGNIGEATLTSVFTLTATPAKTAQFIVFKPVVVQSNIVATVIKSSLVQTNSQFTQTAVAQRTRTSTVAMSALYSQLTVGSEVNSAQALLNSQFTLFAGVRVIVIDAALTYKIPRESRSYKIVDEVRQYRIIEEIRSHNIQDN
jgi:hypothetical protein